ncbi:DNA-3-methyladenine glycosylase family protein [Paradesulfitobacterium ferrireducens]|uniref:DNA-3-methyladenine glycosylase family protein n=1 Tax=Paradesulfitobacterium ferrireducens TaxID=2816476 RepID=UPI001A8F31BD|nr:DNA-3-methyladenine glycosylase 2 family protein [Paradesulfitobacterium ferrireducens]
MDANRLDAKAAFAFLSEDECLGPVVRRWGICPFEPHTEYFRELCESILAQQISGKVARSLADRLLARVHHRLTPEVLVNVSLDELRALGISARKGETLHALAQGCLQEQIPLERLGELPEEEIRVILTRVKGIGDWTVMMFLIFSLNRPRVIPASDFGIRKAIQGLYRLPELPAPDAVKGYFQAWAPHETAAAWYLWRSLENDGRA